MVAIVSLLVLLVLTGSFVFYKAVTKPRALRETAPAPKPIIPVPTADATPSAVPTASPSPTVSPVIHNPSLIALHIDAIDHSHGHPAGIVPSARVKLFKMDGTFVEEKRPSPYVQNGPVGSGGDAIFYVLPSTYKVEADAGTMSGTCIITVRTTTEFNSCAIYMVAKTVRISGRYYLDSNRNGQHDDGERDLGDKKIFLVFKGEDGKIYSAGETKTDAAGHYSLEVSYTGSFSANGESEPGYSPPAQRWISLEGGQSGTYDLGLVPM